MAGQDIRALLLILAAALSWLELLLSCKVIFYYLFTMDVVTKWQSLEIVRSYNPWGYQIQSLRPGAVGFRNKWSRHRCHKRFELRHLTNSHLQKNPF